MPSPPLNGNPGKSGKRHGNQPGRDQNDRHAGKRLGRLRQLQTHPHAGKKDNRQHKAKDLRKTRIPGIPEVIAVRHILQSNTQYRAVCRDQRQINAQRVIQRGGKAPQKHLDKLHKRRDD